MAFLFPSAGRPWLSRLLVASFLGCATQQPTPSHTLPTHYQRYAEPDATASVLLDVVDGPSLVRRPDPKSPTLCATPCELVLPPGEHKLHLFFLDEYGIATNDEARVLVDPTPSVHRRALSRTRTDRMGMRVAALIFYSVGVGVAIAGTTAALRADDSELRKAMGITAASGVLGMGIAFGFHALGTTRLRGSDLRFTRIGAP